MQLGTVIGHATATIKHKSYVGWRLVIVQPLNARNEPETDPVVAADAMGAAPGQTVVVCSDGIRARQVIGDDTSPLRWFTVAIVDE